MLIDGSKVANALRYCFMFDKQKKLQLILVVLFLIFVLLRASSVFVSSAIEWTELIRARERLDLYLG